MPLDILAATYYSSSTDSGAAATVSMLVFLPFMVLGLLSFIGWVVMLVHAIQHDIENKTVWIIMMILFSVTWIIYYFIVKMPFDKAHKTVGGATKQTPTDPDPTQPESK